MFDLSGQVAVVTGAGAGLGVEFCEVLAEAGANIICADINEENLAAVAQKVEAYGRKALPIRCDVSNEADVVSLYQAVKETFGGVDILINNAGIADPKPAPVHEYDSANWKRVIDINLNGLLYCSREALKLMIDKKRGKIINIASIWGLRGAANIFPIPAYNATKGAVVNLTREMALEYASYNIHVNAICPGFYRTTLAGGAYKDPAFVEAVTNITPMGRIADASEIRGPALFLASPASDYVTGLMLVADGGVTAK